ncbi:hypothetical protein [Almyronema epifaneia]|uniref:Uncharacterized protein n=1 Tax=Almyronema epifaneia S1 TaxID=2991925 RepID=A0ABW6IAU7_9CYAN
MKRFNGSKPPAAKLPAALCSLPSAFRYNAQPLANAAIALNTPPKTVHAAAAFSD